MSNTDGQQQNACCFVATHSEPSFACRGAENAQDVWLYAHGRASRYPPLLTTDTQDFTVVVPVYNGEQYLRKCIESLLHQQTHYRYEIVCVDDGSSDGSLAILNDLQASHPDTLKVFAQKNGGISAARNKGIEMAQGTYIGFVDNDDTVSPHYIETLVNALNEQHADMVQCGHRRVTANGIEIYESQRAASVVLENDHTIDYIEQISGFVWAGAYRKQMWEKTRFNEGFWYEDMLTKLLLGRQSRRTVILSDCLYNYTLTGSNSSDTLWKATSPKSLDSLYLPMRLFAFSNNVLQLQHDAPLDAIIVHELCWQLPNRAARVGKGVLKAAFVVVSDFLRRNNIHVDDPRHSWDKLCQAALNGDYLRWKYTARAEMWRSKIVRKEHPSPLHSPIGVA